MRTLKDKQAILQNLASESTLITKDPSKNRVGHAKGIKIKHWITILLYTWSLILLFFNILHLLVLLAIILAQAVKWPKLLLEHLQGSLHYGQLLTYDNLSLPVLAPLHILDQLNVLHERPALWVLEFHELIGLLGQVVRVCLDVQGPLGSGLDVRGQGQLWLSFSLQLLLQVLQLGCEVLIFVLQGIGSVGEGLEVLLEPEDFAYDVFLV